MPMAYFYHLEDFHILSLKNTPTYSCPHFHNELKDTPTFPYLEPCSHSCLQTLSPNPKCV